MKLTRGWPGVILMALFIAGCIAAGVSVAFLLIEFATRPQ